MRVTSFVSGCDAIWSVAWNYRRLGCRNERSRRRGHIASLLQPGAPLVKHIVACDLSAAMVNVAQMEARRRGLANLEVHQGVAARLPYPDARFDVVVSRYSAHHWHDARYFEIQDDGTFTVDSMLMHMQC